MIAIGSLTMSYFHTGIRTIIGAESFHCPVRDGKEWDQLAMVIRLKPVTDEAHGLVRQFVESFDSASIDCAVPEDLAIHRINSSVHNSDDLESSKL